MDGLRAWLRDVDQGPVHAQQRLLAALQGAHHRAHHNPLAEVELWVEEAQAEVLSGIVRRPGPLILEGGEDLEVAAHQRDFRAAPAAQPQHQVPHPHPHVAEGLESLAHPSQGAAAAAVRVLVFVLLGALPAPRGFVPIVSRRALRPTLTPFSVQVHQDLHRVQANLDLPRGERRPRDGERELLGKGPPHRDSPRGAGRCC